MLAMSDAVWMQLIALGEHFVDKIIPALTLISVIVGTYLSARNRSAIGHVQNTVDLKSEEIKESARVAATTAAENHAEATARVVRDQAERTALVVKSQADDLVVQLQDRIVGLQRSQDSTTNSRKT